MIEFFEAKRMKNKRLFSLIFLFVAGSVTSLQAVEQDNYAQELLVKSREFIEARPDSALFYAGVANAYAKENKLPILEAESAQIMGHVYFWKGDQNAARNLFQTAHSILERVRASPDLIANSFLELAYLERQTQNYNAALELALGVWELYTGLDSLEKHPLIHAKVLALQGSIFEDLGSYDLALEDFSKSMNIYQELADSNGISDMYSRIGNVRYLMGENEEALSTYREALSLERLKGNRMGEMMSYCQMGLVELQRGYPREAQNAHFEALRIAQEDGMSRGIADNQMYIGRICLEMDEPDSALIHFNAALAIWEVPGIKIRMGQTLLGMARAQSALKNPQESLSYARRAANLAGEANDKKTEAESLELVSVIREARGEFRLSLAAQRQAQEVRMRIFELEQASKNTEMRVRFEHQQAVASLEMQSAKQDMDLALQEEALRKNNLVQSILIGIFILVLFFVILLVRGLRNNRRKTHLLEVQGEEILRKNEELNEIQAELKATNTNLELLVDERTDALKDAVTSLIEVNEELDTFIYRASHDLLGPIARLKGLSLLLRQTEIADPSPYVELIDSVSIYMDRVLRKLILVHDITKPKNNTVRSSIQEIIGEIEPGLSEIPGIESPNIYLDSQIDKEVPFPTQLVRVALENVIENACIFRDKAAGNNPDIFIKAFLSDGNLVIETKDQGIGIPEEIHANVFDIFFRGSERSKGNGLGLYLVYKAAEAMGGDVDLESVHGEFTLVRLTLPLEEKDFQNLKQREPVLA